MPLSKGLRALRSFGSFAEVSKTDIAQEEDWSPRGGVAVVSFADLIAQERWDAVREFLSNPNTDETRAIILSCQYFREGSDPATAASNNPLHFACRFYPPWDVLKAIDRIHPDFMTQVDSTGRTALHVAAKHGASPQVIRFLCAKYPDAAGAQDVFGRLPLHNVCKHYTKRYNPAKCEDVPLAESMRDVVRTLCRTAPKSVNLEDVDGFSALEYAIEYDAPFKVVRDIQKSCEKDWKKRRSSSGLDHESLQKDLKDQFHAQRNRLKLEIMKLTDSSLSMSASEEPHAQSDSIKENDPVFGAASEQLQVMLSSRRERPSEPAGAMRAMCA